MLNVIKLKIWVSWLSRFQNLSNCILTSPFLFQSKKKPQKAKGKKGDKDLNDLKQELELDEHKVPIEELFQRLTVNPDTVCLLKFFVVYLLYCLN